MKNAAIPKVLVHCPIFAARAFRSGAKSCKLMGVRCPAAPSGKCCATWSVSALFVRTSGDAMGIL